MKGKRSKITKKGSKRLFRATSAPHPLNNKPRPMRGGFRI